MEGSADTAIEQASSTTSSKTVIQASSAVSRSLKQTTLSSTESFESIGSGTSGLDMLTAAPMSGGEDDRKLVPIDTGSLANKLGRMQLVDDRQLMDSEQQQQQTSSMSSVSSVQKSTSKSVSSSSSTSTVVAAEQATSVSLTKQKVVVSSLAMSSSSSSSSLTSSKSIDQQQLQYTEE